MTLVAQFRLMNTSRRRECLWQGVRFLGLPSSLKAGLSIFLGSYSCPASIARCLSCTNKVLLAQDVESQQARCFENDSSEGAGQMHNGLRIARKRTCAFLWRPAGSFGRIRSEYRTGCLGFTVSRCNTYKLLNSVALSKCRQHNS